MIEKLTKRRVQVETMLWDGTDERAAEIQAWVGYQQVDVSVPGSPPEMVDGGPGFEMPDEPGEQAMLYVAYNSSWSPLPAGYRVAREIDGSGFYPLSPEGAAAGYEMPGAAPAERQFPIGSLMDAVLPDGVHRYWSTHCRHGNHDLCKGACKGCGARCLCSTCTHQHLEGTDEELHELVTDAIKVGDVARRYARLYSADADTVLAAVEATLHVLDQREPVEESTPLDSPEPAFRCPVCPHAVRDHTEDGCPGCGCEARAVPLDAPPAGEVPLATGGIVTDPPVLLVGEGPIDWAAAMEQSQRAVAVSALLAAEYAPMLGPNAGRWTPASPGDTPGDLVPGEADNPQPIDAAVPVPPPVDALFPAHWERGHRLDLDKRATERPDPWCICGAAWLEGSCEVLDAIKAAWAAGVEEGRRQDEQASMQTLAERDEYHEAADKLAAAIADAYGVDIGEHSSDNDPWQNALDAVTEAGGGRWVRAAHEDGVAEGRRQATEERTEADHG